MPPRDEDEVADGAEAPQDGGAGAQARQPQAEAEAEAEAGGEGRPPGAQEAPHRLLLLHGGFSEDLQARKSKCKVNAGNREGMW